MGQGDFGPLIRDVWDIDDEDIWPRGNGPPIWDFWDSDDKIVKIFGPRGRGPPMVARQALSAYLHLKGEPDLWSR